MTTSDMRCGACGYTRSVKRSYINEATFFKSGKRKGQFKEVNNREVVLTVGHTDFIEHRIITGFGPCGHIETQDVYVCPDCGTMKWGEA